VEKGAQEAGKHDAALFSNRNLDDFPDRVNDIFPTFFLKNPGRR
jgi:hypothetical protein